MSLYKKTRDLSGVSKERREEFEKLVKESKEKALIKKEERKKKKEEKEKIEREKPIIGNLQSALREASLI